MKKIVMILLSSLNVF